MKTEKLYDLDSYVTEFECTVVQTLEKDDDLLVVTDKTAFFPEGGGQSSDIGTLGGLKVCDVQIEEGIIYHRIKNFETNSVKIKQGDKICASVNFQKRFSDMQQHSGEHIFSGIVHSLFGYDNVGFHLVKDEVTLDFNGILSKEDITKVEKLVNKAIWANKKIHVFYPSEKELETIEYRSKKEIKEALRLVEIPGVDMCACCAPHVARTGEIGVAIVVSSQKVRGGTRLSILCGERALLDLRNKLEQNKAVSNLLCVKESETFEAVQKLKKDNSQLAYDLSKIKLETLKARAKDFEQKKRTIVFCEITDTNMLREYADLLSKKSDDFAAVFGGDDGDYKYVLISGNGFDLNALCKKINAEFCGRGGGRNGIVQGSLKGKKEEIEHELQSF